MVAFFISHSYRNTNAFNQASGFRKSCSKYIVTNFIMFVKSWLVNGQKISLVEWSLAADFPFKFTLNVYFCHALRYNSTGQYGGFRRPLKGPIVLAINWSICYCMSACRCIRMNHICYCRFEEMTCILCSLVLFLFHCKLLTYMLISFPWVFVRRLSLKIGIALEFVFGYSSFYSSCPSSSVIL